MKNKKVVLTAVFFILSMLLCIIFVVSSVNAENENVKKKKENLNYLSNMMKILAENIEEKSEEQVRLTAAMISSSGVVSSLDAQNAETVYGFLHGLIGGSVSLSDDAVIFARRCSAAALTYIKGEIYKLGDLTLLNNNAAARLSGGFDYKNKIIVTSKRDGISYYNFINGEKICQRRSNVYYITNAESGIVEENVFIKEAEEHATASNISDAEVNTILKNKFPKRKISDLEVILVDENTKFVKCKADSSEYIIGIDMHNKNISHIKAIIKE